ncbi:ribose-phosphate pyrophosphokinase [Taklimakanibacter deserti]|uniref:ribose-phosphate pyrophosphokinase n=1 Tax=Taklimakanibacter deserti TaxID=2267839 RepID=UPI000E64B822
MRDSHASFDELPGTPVSDIGAVRTLLIAAAKARRDVSYAELLMELGHRFSRPKMRALCRTLDAIDEAGREAGEPELAALVVRESDRLPGQGWWVGKVYRLSYEGPWTGKEALAFVQGRQKLAFDYWNK